MEFLFFKEIFEDILGAFWFLKFLKIKKNFESKNIKKKNKNLKVLIMTKFLVQKQQ
jgi:hypothetical protein